MDVPKAACHTQRYFVPGFASISADDQRSLIPGGPDSLARLGDGSQAGVLRMTQFGMRQQGRNQE